MDRSREQINDRPSQGTICLRRRDRAFCPVCEKLVNLLSFAESAAIFGSDVEDVISSAASGALHRLHNRKGEVMICTDSLFKCFESRQTRLLSREYLTSGNAG